MQILHKFLSLLLAFSVVFQTIAPGLVVAQEVIATPAPEESPAPTLEAAAEPSEATPQPSPTSEVIPTPQPSPEIVVEPQPSPSPEPSESPQPAVTEEVQASPSPDATLEPTPTPSHQTDTTSETSDNANQSNAPPADENQTDVTQESSPTPTSTPAPSETPLIETSQIQGQLATYILENTSADSAEQVLDIDPVNGVESASLSTDKADYAPTDTAVIAGKDFPKVAELKLIISAENYRFEAGVTTDENGAFVYFYQLDGTYRPLYIVEAYDLSATLLATVTFTDSPVSGCTTDSAGANDLPGQKDLTKMCVDYANLPNTVGVSWNWDKVNFTGANTGDACSLFDTDGDGLANYAVCVGVNGNPATLSYTTLYSCGDDSASKCTSPATALTPSANTTCGVSGGTDPFTNGEASPDDTQASCTVSLSDVGGATASLIDVCSFPSGQPNSAADDCIIFKEKTGRIEVVKVLDPATDTGLFNLQINGTTYAADVTNGGTTGEQVLSVQNTGTNYTVGETAGTNTDLTKYTSAIVCKDLNGTGNIVAQSDSFGPLSVLLQDQQDIVCTITNTLKQGSLTVIKQVVGGEAISSNWTMHISNAQTPDVVTPFPGTDSPGTAVSLVAGSYIVSETGGSLDYSLTYSGDCDSSGHVSVIVGQTKVCILTNSRDSGTITVNKILVPSADLGKFDLKIDGVAYAVAVGNSGTTGQVSVATGQHTVSEVGNNTNLSDYSVVIEGDCAADGTVTVGKDQNKVCTITNTRKGHLIVQKTTLPSSDATLFNINLTGTGIITGSSAGVISDVLDRNYEVTPGTYSVSETVPPGWDKTQDTCQNILISAGQTATCTITNTKRGSITIVKDANPNDPQDFSFSGDLGNFQLDDDSDPTLENSTTFTNLVAGTYAVSETVSALWDQTGATCSDGSLVNNIDLSPGENITCTFTNAKRAHLTINKVIVPPIYLEKDLGKFDILLDGVVKIDDVTDQQTQIFGQPASTDPDGTTGQMEMVAGVYTISEEGVDGTNTQDYGGSVTCQGTGFTLPHPFLNQVPVNITLSNGAEVVCTILNIQGTPQGVGSLIVVKNSIGGDDTFNYTATSTVPGTIIPDNSNVGPFSITTVGGTGTDFSNTVTAAPGFPANVTLTETSPPPGWDFTGVECITDGPFGGGNGQSTFNYNGSSVNITFFDEETVTCTFTNTQRGHLIVQKTTLPSGDQTVFDILASGTGAITGGGAGTITDMQDKDYEVTPGIYSVTETLPLGWSETINTCQGVVVTAGETVICSIVNTKLATMIVEKQTDPDGDQTGFTFTGDISGTISDGQQLVITDLPGSYTSTEIVPAYWDLTDISCDDNNSTGDLLTSTATFNLDPGEVVKCTFTNTQRGTIAGTKFEVNSDGSLVGVLSGWVISLFDSNNNLVTQTSTDASGNFSFVNIVNGIYTLAEDLLSGWTQIFAPVQISLNAGGSSIDNDFGNFQNGLITGMKFNDLNGNGQKDQGESGLENWTIFIDANGNGVLDQGESVQTTDVNGDYTFTNLVPGLYTVCEEEQTGWLRIKPAQSNCESVNMTNSNQSSVVDFGNQQILPAVLALSGKTNNRMGTDVPPGADVLYTLSTELIGSAVNDVTVTDLLPNGFKYRKGSWTSLSSVRGDLKALGITPEPTYASPGTWQLGDMVPGEMITLSWIADIDSGIDLGLYKDLSYAKGVGSQGEIFANESTGIFIGTQVNVAIGPQGGSHNVETIEERSGEVLAIATTLPATLPQTGADSRWLILASSILLLGLISLGAGLIWRKRYE